MRFIRLILLSLLSTLLQNGCSPGYPEPLGRQDSSDLFGRWVLSTASSQGWAEMKKRGFSTSEIEIKPGKAKLTSVLVLDQVADDYTHPKYEWAMVQGGADWDFDEIPHQNEKYSARIFVYPPGHSMLSMSVRKRCQANN